MAKDTFWAVVSADRPLNATYIQLTPDIKVVAIFRPKNQAIAFINNMNVNDEQRKKLKVKKCVITPQ